MVDRVVLVAEGNHQPSLFDDVIEVVNVPWEESIPAPIDAFVRTDHGFRVCPNFSEVDSHHPLAIMNSIVDPFNPHQDPRMFRTVDANAMMDALVTHDVVMFGTLLASHATSDYGLLSQAGYFVRESDGTLRNLTTNEIIVAPVSMATFVSMVQVGSLPVYYMIVDHNLVKVGTGFDVERGQTLYKKVGGNDEPPRHLFEPTVDAIVVNGNIFTSKDAVAFDFFHQPYNPISRLKIELTLGDVDVLSSLSYNIHEGRIVFNVPDRGPHYAIIEFKAGAFFSGAHKAEKLRFEYIIHNTIRQEEQHADITPDVYAEARTN